MNEMAADKKIAMSFAADAICAVGEIELKNLLSGYSHEAAVKWLRAKFGSFETAADGIGAEIATKTEVAHFAAVKALGRVAKLPAEKKGEANIPLIVAAVEMKKDLGERTSRSVQFAFAKKLIQNAIANAKGFDGIPAQGLFFFHDAEGRFRLSLVSGKVEGRRLKFGETKRQSFFVDPAAANNIVKRRLAGPLKSFAAVKDAFSVEQLTKEFYGKLFEWYTWAMAAETNVTFPNDLDDRTDDRKYNNEAIIRLVTRLMFTWFIRQRKLAPDALFDPEALKGMLKDFDPVSMEQTNYYRAILQNLFFATFNCPQHGKDKLTRRWICAKTDESGNPEGLSGDYGVTTVYRYRNEFSDPDGFLEMMRKVPFLNCALFDCLDRTERKEDGGRKLYFDGFSTGKRRQARVPNRLFFDEEKGIVTLFGRYEFTVNENDADDSDVALDPELLGKVFENLLGAFNPETQETARKATGSFYTPREIVDYMVEESLKNHLKTKCPFADDARLADFFDREKAAEAEDDKNGKPLFGADERAALLDALYGCRILDPACGSGAFPMGILHCMVRLLARLDPDCMEIRKRLLARYRADKEQLGADAEEERRELESRLEEGQHYPDYERKLYLIENCIYGVDIQPIATQISKLRFFISLLCDQMRTNLDPEAENAGLLSLPNLEAKFVCANTLIALPDVEENGLSVANVKELQDKLQANRHQIFRARSTKTKEKHKRKDREIRDEIRQAVRDSIAKPDEGKIALWEAEIAKLRQERQAVAEPDWAEAAAPVQTTLFGDEEQQLGLEKVDRNAKRRGDIDARIHNLEKSVAKELGRADPKNMLAATQYANLVAGWDPYDQNASSPFFDPHWMLNIKDGFDVVIGNPPYVQLQANGGALGKMYEDSGYRTATKTGDLYFLFYEQGIKLLAKRGHLCYITSDKWMRIEGGKELRAFLAEESAPQTLIDFRGQQLFEGATVETNILLAQRKAKQDEAGPTAACNMTAIEESIRETFAKTKTECKFPKDEIWVIRSAQEQAIEAKIKAKGKPLKEFGIKINRGVLTGCNEAFIVDEATKDKLLKEDASSAEIVKPIIRGRDVGRFGYKVERWLIGTFPALDLDIEKFPAVRDYLLSFGKEKLEQSGKKDIGGIKGNNARKKTSNKWFETQDQISYWEEFAKEKIFWKRIGSDLRFAYSDESVYGLDSTCVMTGEHLKYLVVLMNSRMGHYLLKDSPRTGMGDLLISVQAFDNFLTPDNSADEVAKVEALYEQVASGDAAAVKICNQIFYDGFGLTAEEIAIVEGKDAGGEAPGAGGAPAGKAGAKSSAPKRQKTKKHIEDDEELE